MDLDDDELRATRNALLGKKGEVNEEKEYKIYSVNKDGKYYAKEIYVGGPEVIRMIPTISRQYSACFVLEKAEEYVELLRENNKDPNVTFGYEEV